MLINVDLQSIVLNFNYAWHPTYFCPSTGDSPILYLAMLSYALLHQLSRLDAAQGRTDDVLRSERWKDGEKTAQGRGKGLGFSFFLLTFFWGFGHFWSTDSKISVRLGLRSKIVWVIWFRWSAVSFLNLWIAEGGAMFATKISLSFSDREIDG